MTPTPAASRSVGQFAWNTTTGDWSWDAGMFELHGYQAGAVEVSTDLVLKHKHGDHRAHAAAVLEASGSGDQRFSNYHAIVDVDGRTRMVLTVGVSQVITTRPTLSNRMSRGFMVDVTQDEHDITRLAVARARRSTASIQQSTGLLMGSLGLTEEAAFAVLARVSSHHNVKVRDLARRFMAAAVDTAVKSPRDLSHLLMTQATALAVERATDAGS